MGKSLNNFITLDQLFSGENQVLEQAYSPMTVRFFILQAHYRSPLDFSNAALKAASKGYERLLAAVAVLDRLAPVTSGTPADVEGLERRCFEALDDDLNTPVLIAHLFEGARLIYSIADGQQAIDADGLERLRRLYRAIIFDILGLKVEEKDETPRLQGVVDVVMKVRERARQEKDWATSDRIRDDLKQAGIVIKDTKDGYEWHVDNGN
jgi:cysteinyl-tRNA synthetase